jgi:hypothetical protein
MNYSGLVKSNYFRTIIIPQSIINQQIILSFVVKIASISFQKEIDPYEF